MILPDFTLFVIYVNISPHQWTMICPLPKNCSCWRTLRWSSNGGSVTSSNASQGSTHQRVLPLQHRTPILKRHHAPLLSTSFSATFPQELAPYVSPSWSRKGPAQQTAAAVREAQVRTGEGFLHFEFVVFLHLTSFFCQGHTHCGSCVGLIIFSFY